MRKLCPCVQTQCTHSFTRSYSLRHKHKYTFGMQNQQHEHLCLSCAHVRIHRVLIIVLVSLGRPGCTPISNSAQIYQIIFLLIYGMGSLVGHPLTRRKAGEHFFCNNFSFFKDILQEVFALYHPFGVPGLVWQFFSLSHALHAISRQEYSPLPFHVISGERSKSISSFCFSL